jgi:hypothetical protein
MDPVRGNPPFMTRPAGQDAGHAYPDDAKREDRFGQIPTGLQPITTFARSSRTNDRQARPAPRSGRAQGRKAPRPTTSICRPQPTTLWIQRACSSSRTPGSRPFSTILIPHARKQRTEKSMTGGVTRR